MRDMEIEILKNKYGSLFATEKDSCYNLFQFEYRSKDQGGPAWYFWLRGNYDPDIFNGDKKSFPMDFFKDACRAKMFILKGGRLNDEVSIVKGKEFLTK